MRANAKEEKLRILAEKQQKKDEDIQTKQASLQLQTELVVRAKEVQKPIQAQKQSDPRGKKDVVEVEDRDPPPPQNSYGRKIQLPKRYQSAI